MPKIDLCPNLGTFAIPLMQQFLLHSKLYVHFKLLSSKCLKYSCFKDISYQLQVASAETSCQYVGI